MSQDHLQESRLYCYDYFASVIIVPGTCAIGGIIACGEGPPIPLTGPGRPAASQYHENQNGLNTCTYTCVC